MKRFNKNVEVKATTVEIINPRNSKINFAKKFAKEATYNAGVQIAAGMLLWGATTVVDKVSRKLIRKRAETLSDKNNCAEEN